MVNLSSGLRVCRALVSLDLSEGPHSPAAAKLGVGAAAAIARLVCLNPSLTPSPHSPAAKLGVGASAAIARLVCFVASALPSP